MSIYSMNISNVSRNKGSSSIATLAYISGQKAKDERLNKTFNYGRKERVECCHTVLPEYAPKEFYDPKVLFNSLEENDKTSNARIAKKIMVALPRELSLDEQNTVVQNYIKNNLNNNGYCAAYAIHVDKAGNNPHGHILIANRQLDKAGKWTTKYKKDYALDEKGERIPIIDETTGVQKIGKNNRKMWKRVNVQMNQLDLKETLLSLRKNWAIECNKYLSEEHKIDERSYKDQGVYKIPKLRETIADREMAKRGIEVERIKENEKIELENVRNAHLLQKIQFEYDKLQKEMDKLLVELEEDMQRPTDYIFASQAEYNEFNEDLLKNHWYLYSKAYNDKTDKDFYHNEKMADKNIKPYFEDFKIKWGMFFEDIRTSVLTTITSIVENIKENAVIDKTINRSTYFQDFIKSKESSKKDHKQKKHTHDRDER